MLAKLLPKMSQTSYIWHCCVISLRKRLSHLLMSGFLALLLLLIYASSLFNLISGPLLVVALHATVICIQSSQRHRYDLFVR